MSSRDGDLSVVVRTPQQQVVASGPGRLLSKAYLKGGRFIGEKCNRLAHKWGHGPHAAAERIRNVIKSLDRSLMRSVSRTEVGGELEKYCMSLLKYALPTEARAAQLKAFKSIVYLTTYFPGLRHVFLRCKRLQAAGGTKTCIIKLWMGDDTDVAADNSEWNFFLGFAASCIFEDVPGVASLLENSKLNDLGYIPIDTGEYSVIEQLLVASGSCDKFEPWIAIRYLGGILESPSFWEQEPHSNHQTVTKKLFTRVRQLVEDLDIERWAITNVALRVIRGDVQGIDILVSALLNGVGIWHRQEHVPPFDPLISDFARLVELVRHPAAKDLLPQSYSTASHDYITLVRMKYQRESMEIVVLSYSPASTLESTSRPASPTSSVDHPHPAVPSSTTDHVHHNVDQGHPPIPDSSELAPIIQQGPGLGDVDSSIVPHAELRMPLDAAHNVEGGEETKSVGSGNEVGVASETENQGHKLSLPPPRTLPSTDLDESDDEQILYPRIRIPLVSKSNSLSSPNAAHRPYGGETQPTPLNKFQHPPTPASNDDQRMEQLLAALNLPSARYDAPLENAFRNSSENLSVPASNKSNGRAERSSGLDINVGAAKTLETRGGEAFDYPPDGDVPVDQAIYLLPPHELSMPPPSLPLPTDVVSEERGTPSPNDLLSSSLPTYHQPMGRQSALLSVNDSPNTVIGSPIQRAAEKEDAAAVADDLAPLSQFSRVLSTSKRSSLPSFPLITLPESTASANRSSSQALVVESKNNLPSFDVTRSLPGGIQEGWTDNKTNVEGLQAMSGIRNRFGQVVPGISAMPDLMESGNNADSPSSAQSSPVDPLTPADSNVPPEFDDYSDAPTNSDLALQPNGVVDADLFSAWSSFLRETAHSDSAHLSRGSSLQSPQSIRSGFQISSVATSLNQSDSLSSARATVATSTSSRPPTTISRTALRFESDSSTPSEFSLVDNPSSLALSELRQTSPYVSFPAPVPSPQKNHMAGFLGLFRTKTTRPRSDVDMQAVTPQATTVPSLIPASLQRSPSAGSYSPFRYLTSKRGRNMSLLSVEAQDGTEPSIFESQSQPEPEPNQFPIPVPPRDPMLAIREWRDREAAEAPSKVRRRRPGVVFDVAEDPTEAQRPRPRPRRALPPAGRGDPN